MAGRAYSKVGADTNVPMAEIPMSRAHPNGVPPSRFAGGKVNPVGFDADADGKQAGFPWLNAEYRGIAHQYAQDPHPLPPAVQEKYDKYDCPNIFGNAEMMYLWERRLQWTHILLFIGWAASWISQAAVYATSNKFNVCVNVGHDMLNGVPLAGTEKRIGGPHLFWWTIWPPLLMFLFHGTLSLFPKYFYDWYHLNVRHEQAAVKYFVSAVPWFFLTLVLGSVVGITNIFVLLPLGILSGIGEICIGIMEWHNANGFKKHNESVANVRTIFTEKDSMGWFDDILHKFVIPDVYWGPMWICGFSHMMVVGTLMAYFGFAMAHHGSEMSVFVIVALSVYIATLGLEIIQSVLYWKNVYPCIAYVNMEWLHLVGRFIFWNLVIFLILGGLGNHGHGSADGCLYALP